MVNQGTQEFVIQPTDHIAQLIFELYNPAPIQEVQEHTETTQGEQRFGSTNLAKHYQVHVAPILTTVQLKAAVPPKYHEFLDVFDESQVTKQCPLSCTKYNFKINLEPNATLPCLMQPYHLSQKELVTMNQWLNKKLAAKMIEPCTTHCPTAAPVSFVPKKDGTKRPVIDY
jgi:hypothetical protein